MPGRVRPDGRVRGTNRPDANRTPRTEQNPPSSSLRRVLPIRALRFFLDVPDILFLKQIPALPGARDAT